MKTLFSLAVIVFSLSVGADPEGRTSSSIDPVAARAACEDKGGNLAYMFFFDYLNLDDLAYGEPADGRTNRQVLNQDAQELAIATQKMVEGLLASETAEDRVVKEEVEGNTTQQLLDMTDAPVILDDEKIAEIRADLAKMVEASKTKYLGEEICVSGVVDVDDLLLGVGGLAAIAALAGDDQGLAELEADSFNLALALAYYAASKSSAVCSQMAEVVGRTDGKLKYQYVCTVDDDVVSLTDAAPFLGPVEVEAQLQ